MGGTATYDRDSHTIEVDKSTLYRSGTGLYDATEIDVDAYTPANATDAGTYEIVASFKFANEAAQNNYNAPGTITGTLTINPADITSAQNVNATITGSYTYTGSDIEPPIAVKSNNDLTLETSEYDAVWTDNVNAGGASVRVTGKGNFTGAAIATFVIDKQQVSVPTAVEGLTYDSTTLQGVYVADGMTDIYYLQGERGQTAGTYTARACLVDVTNYIWDLDPAEDSSTDQAIEWVINTKSITIAMTASQKEYSTPDPAFAATGLEDLVDPTDLGSPTYVRTNDDEAVDTYADVLTARYTPNPNYDVTIVPASFTITKANMATGTIAAIPVQPYTGSAIKPVPGVSLYGRDLEFGTDYTLEYYSDETCTTVVENPVDLGTYYVRAIGAGDNYEGATSTPQSFRIVEVAADVIKADGSSTPYESVARALENANGYGSTVRLKKDVTESVVVPDASEVKFDLYGHTITAEEGQPVLTVPATSSLAILDSTEAKLGTITGANVAVSLVVAEGVVDVQSGNLVTGAGITAPQINVSGTATVRGGTFTYETGGSAVSARAEGSKATVTYGLFAGTDATAYLQRGWSLPKLKESPRDYYGPRRDISSASGSVTVAQAAYPFTGVAIKPVPEVVWTDKSVYPNADLRLSASTEAVDVGAFFTYVYLDADGNEVSDPQEVGTYTIRVTGTGDYTGVVDITFDIVPVNLITATLKFTSAYEAYATDGVDYTSLAYEPEVYAYLDNDGTGSYEAGGADVMLEKGPDYAVKYTDATNAGTGLVTIIPGTNGNFTGSNTISFEIHKRSLAATDGTIAISGMRTDNYPYSGDPIKPVPNVTFTYREDGEVRATTNLRASDVTQQFGDWFNIAYYAASDTERTTPVEPVTEGDYVVVLTGTGNFEGVVELPFTIGAAFACVVYADETGTEVTVPYATLREAFAAAPTGSVVRLLKDATGDNAEDDVVLAEGIDTTLDLRGLAFEGSITNNGTLSVVAGGDAASFKAAAGKSAIVNNGTLTLQSGTYNGNADAPVIATAAGSTTYVNGGTYDYPTTSSVISGAGSAQVGFGPILSGHDADDAGYVIYGYELDHISEADQRYTAKPSVAFVAIEGVANTYTYNGSPIAPEPTRVTWRSTAISKDAEYTVSYAEADGTARASAPTEVGTYQVVLKGINSYTGTYTQTFQIVPKSITHATVTVPDHTDRTYTGEALTEDVTITDNETGTPVALVKDTDYTVTYSHNTNAGTATVVYQGTGNYTNQVVKTFTINPKPISTGYTLTAPTTMFDRLPHTPEVTVSETAVDGSPVLDASNYRLNYYGREVTLAGETSYYDPMDSMTAAGTYYVVATGTGNYTGTCVGTYVIEPASIEGFTPADVQKDYNGEVQAYDGSVTLGGLTLKEGTEYEIVYQRATTTDGETTWSDCAPTDVKNVGSYRVYASGLGDYAGKRTTATGAFDILEVDKRALKSLIGVDAEAADYEASATYDKDHVLISDGAPTNIVIDYAYEGSGRTAGENLHAEDVYTTSTAKQSLATHIGDARAIYDNENVTAQQVYDAVRALSASKTTFDASKRVLNSNRSLNKQVLARVGNATVYQSSDQDQTYTTKAIEPALFVWFDSNENNTYDAGEPQLVEGKDYVLGHYDQAQDKVLDNSSHTDNVNVAEATDTPAPTVHLSGVGTYYHMTEGAYDSYLDVPFTIVQASLAGASIEVTSTKTYDNTVYAPTVVVKLNGEVVAPENYDLTWYKNGTEIAADQIKNASDQYTVKATGKLNCKDTTNMAAPFSIAKRDWQMTTELLADGDAAKMDGTLYSLPFDNTPHSVSVSYTAIDADNADRAGEGANDVAVSYTYNGKDHTSETAGNTYAVVASFSNPDSENYNDIASVSGTLEIRPSTLTKVTVTEPEGGYVYTMPQAPRATTSSSWTRTVTRSVPRPTAWPTIPTSTCPTSMRARPRST